MWCISVAVVILLEGGCWKPCAIGIALVASRRIASSDLAIMMLIFYGYDVRVVDRMLHDTVRLTSNGHFEIRELSS